MEMPSLSNANTAVPDTSRNSAKLQHAGEMLGEFVRRTADIIVSIMVLSFSAPILLVLIFLVRMDSPGPALFRQKRVGRNRRRATGGVYHGPERRKEDFGGELFWFVKLRTMYEDARKRFPELYAYRFTEEEVDDLQFKTQDDPRHTRLGRWLRRTSLDELPNFWSVLTGHMTLVGPRPDIPEITRYYRPEQKRIFDVKPGVTGYAQVRGRCALKFQQTKAYDVQYVDERSLWTDLKVLVETVLSVVTAKGAF